jgi:hypothetical protein
MKKWIKIISICLATLFLLAVSFEIVIAIKNPFLWGFWKTYIPSLFASTGPDWKRYSSPDGRLSLESPFPMKWEKTAKIKNGKGYEDFNGKSQHNRTGFSIDILSGRYLKLNTTPSSNDSIKIEKWAYQQEANFQWNEQPVKCSGMPATLVAYSFDINGNPLHFLRILVNNKNQFWDISVGTYQKDLNTYNEWSKRIIESIKIEPTSQ